MTISEAFVRLGLRQARCGDLVHSPPGDNVNSRRRQPTEGGDVGHNPERVGPGAGSRPEGIVNLKPQIAGRECVCDPVGVVSHSGCFPWARAHGYSRFIPLG